MRRLIEDLLKLSSLETTDEPGNTDTVKLPDIVRNIIEEARTISGNSSHTFKLNLDENLWLEGDRNQIYSAISNVVNNAVQHTPEDGTISIRWYEDDGGGIFEIKDTGEGVSSEHIPRLTERFYRVDKGRSRQKGGTGLGLAIVKHILANHKARLDIESKQGQGSLIRFRFPKSLIIHKDINSDREIAEKETIET
jgi:two-component system phosphate regulon sensor histidine kinase PhoR